MSAMAPIVPSSYFQQVGSIQKRPYITDKKGNALGGEFLIPKKDFAHFLGYKQETPEEKAGDVSGARTLEVALRGAYQDLGEKAVVNGNKYRNMFISHGRYDNLKGRGEDQIRDGLDSVQESVELNQASNMAYLEMQYKFLEASRSFGVISNLMKVRSEATKKCISDVR